MKKSLCVSVLLLSVGLSQAALAKPAATYLGAEVGRSKIDYNPAGADNVKNTDTLLSVYGGFYFTPNVGVELGYADLGKASAYFPAYNETDNYKAKAFYAAVVGKATLSSSVFVSGKFGLSYWDESLDYRGSIGSTTYSGSGSGTGTNIVYGVGLGYQVTPQLSLKASYDVYPNVGDGTTVNISGYGNYTLPGNDVDTYGLSVEYAF